MNTAILLISCPDRKGITARITNFVFQNNGNIEHADQHIDAQTNTFFMRIEWALDNFNIPREKIYDEFSVIASEFAMNWNLYSSDQIPRLAIFTSRSTHCLYDLLLRHEEKQLRCHIPIIISNHDEAEKVANHFNIKFKKFAKTAGDRVEIEKQELKALTDEKIDIIVLARYMQILTPELISRFSNRIINIHHSFLPAFAGKNPYQQAYSRGVKIIGATSHYVTEELDNGPIIEQNTVRISHRDSVEDLKTKGQDLEKVVLSRAVRWHLEHKILVYNNKTVIFD